MKKICSLLIISILLLLFSTYAFAAEAIPYSDSVFTSGTASLSTRKTVNFSLRTLDTQGAIKITSCWLQKKDGTIWRFAKSLGIPSQVAINATSYAASMDYSSAIGSGTYRIGFIANADGHTITRYSNERTY